MASIGLGHIPDNHNKDTIRSEKLFDLKHYDLNEIKPVS